MLSLKGYTEKSTVIKFLSVLDEQCFDLDMLDGERAVIREVPRDESKPGEEPDIYTDIELEIRDVVIRTVDEGGGPDDVEAENIEIYLNNKKVGMLKGNEFDGFRDFQSKYDWEYSD